MMVRDATPTLVAPYAGSGNQTPEQQSFGWSHRRLKIMGWSQEAVVAAESILNNL